jgi:hypothetical protein
MTFRTCSFEKELTQALKDGHWPQGCGPELRAHVDGCSNCGDLVLVTETFQRARSESERNAGRRLTEPAMVESATAPAECGSRARQPAHHDRADFRLVRHRARRRNLCGVAISPWTAVGIVVAGTRSFTRLSSADVERYLQRIWIGQLEPSPVDLRFRSTRYAERPGRVSGVREILIFAARAAEKIVALQCAHPQVSVSH